MTTEKKIYHSFAEINNRFFPRPIEKTYLPIEEMDPVSIGKKIGREIISNAKQHFKV